MKNFLTKLVVKFGGSALAMMAMMMAVDASSRVCALIAHQPKLPDEVKMLRKF